MVLLHEPQGEANTCMYHATYALTHDAQWLTYARDGPGDPSSDALWLSRLLEVGILCYPHHVAQRAYSAPVDSEFWTWFRSHASGIEPDGEVGLVVTIQGPSLYHAVAVLLDLPTGTVTVSDSCKDALQVFHWPAFLTSRYAHAYRVEMLMHAAPPDP
jgi:hypothetical protein